MRFDRSRRFLLLAGAAFFFAAGLIAGVAMANSDLEWSLKRSRDALLSQRHDLQAEAGRVDRQIDDLRRARSRIEYYLKDTDRALRDVESALRTR